MTPHTRSLTFRASSILPALFLLPLALDFKGADEGGLWQITLFTVSVAAGVAFILFRKIPRSQGRFWQLSSFAVWVTLAGAAITSYLNDIPMPSFGRVAAPVILFGLAYFIGAAMTHNHQGQLLLRLLRWGCAASVVFTVFAGFAVTGADALTVRYQILSPVLLIYEALLINQMLLEKRNRLRISALLLGCLSLQILSVTRSALLAVFLLALGAAWMAAPTLKRFLRTSMNGLLAAGALSAAALVTAQAISPEIGNRWIGRLDAAEQHEVDPTSLSRIAEMAEQLRLWGESPISMLIGRGYGAVYGWSQQYDLQLLETGAFSWEVIDRNYFVAGHNFWVSSLFAGGLLFGLTLPGLLLWASWRGLSTARTLIRSRVDHPLVPHITGSVLMLVASLTVTIGGNPFGTRYSGLVIGAAVGMLVAAKRQLVRDLAAASTSAPAPSIAQFDRMALARGYPPL